MRCMADSMRKIMYVAEHIILLGGIAHSFLGNVYDIVSEVKDKVLNIMDILGVKMPAKGIRKAFVMETERMMKIRIRKIVKKWS